MKYMYIITLQFENILNKLGYIRAFPGLGPGKAPISFPRKAN